MIHSLLSRQLLCSQQYTLWPVVSGNPFRFSIAEFQAVTGLPCAPLPEKYVSPDFKFRNPAKDPCWKRIIGNDSHITISELGDMLENDPFMPYERRLQLALIMIVDGVLIAHKQTARPTLKYVQMVDNVQSFLQFPWGRESFIKTIYCMKPPMDEKDPVGTLVEVLKQTSYRLTGFPLALQLVAFRAMPLLLNKIPAPPNALTLADMTEGHLPQHSSLSLSDFLSAEADPLVSALSPYVFLFPGFTNSIYFMPLQLQVTALIETPQPPTSFPNEPTDERVQYMETLIEQKHKFHTWEWPGGDVSEPLTTVQTDEESQQNKVSISKQTRLLAKKATMKRKASTRKQRRLSSYFRRTNNTTPPTTEFLAEQVMELTEKQSKLESEIEILKKKLSRRQPRIRSTHSKFEKTLNTMKSKKTNQVFTIHKPFTIYTVPWCCYKQSTKIP